MITQRQNMTLLGPIRICSPEYHVSFITLLSSYVAEVSSGPSRHQGPGATITYVAPTAMALYEKYYNIYSKILCTKKHKK